MAAKKSAIMGLVAKLEKAAAKQGMPPLVELAHNPNWDPAKHPHGEHGHWAKKGEHAIFKTLLDLATNKAAPKKATFTGPSGAFAKPHATDETLQVGGVTLNPPGVSKALTADYALAPGEKAYMVTTPTSQTVAVVHPDNSATELVPTAPSEPPKIGKVWPPGEFQVKSMSAGTQVEKLDEAAGGSLAWEAKAGALVVDGHQFTNMPVGTVVRKRYVKYPHVWEDWTKLSNGSWERTGAFKAATPLGATKSAAGFAALVNGKSSFVITSVPGESFAAPKVAKKAAAKKLPAKKIPATFKPAGPAFPEPKAPEKLLPGLGVGDEEALQSLPPGSKVSFTIGTGEKDVFTKGAGEDWYGTDGGLLTTHQIWTTYLNTLNIDFEAPETKLPEPGSTASADQLHVAPHMTVIEVTTPSGDKLYATKNDSGTWVKNDGTGTVYSSQLDTLAAIGKIKVVGSLGKFNVALKSGDKVLLQPGGAWSGEVFVLHGDTSIDYYDAASGEWTNHLPAGHSSLLASKIKKSAAGEASNFVVVQQGPEPLADWESAVMAPAGEPVMSYIQLDQMPVGSQVAVKIFDGTWHTNTKTDLEHWVTDQGIAVSQSDLYDQYVADMIATKTAPEAPPSPPPPTVSVLVHQYAENHEGTHNKFYESAVVSHADGTATQVIRYGSLKPGAHVTTLTKDFETESAAIEAHDKIFQAKLHGGYQTTDFLTMDSVILDAAGETPPKATAPKAAAPKAAAPKAEVKSVAMLNSLPVGTVVESAFTGFQYTKSKSGDWYHDGLKWNTTLKNQVNSGVGDVTIVSTPTEIPLETAPADNTIHSVAQLESLPEGTQVGNANGDLQYTKVNGQWKAAGSTAVYSSTAFGSVLDQYHILTPMPEAEPEIKTMYDATPGAHITSLDHLNALPEGSVVKTAQSTTASAYSNFFKVKGDWWPVAAPDYDTFNGFVKSQVVKGNVTLVSTPGATAPQVIPKPTKFDMDVAPTGTVISMGPLGKATIWYKKIGVAAWEFHNTAGMIDPGHPYTADDLLNAFGDSAVLTYPKGGKAPQPATAVPPEPVPEPTVGPVAGTNVTLAKGQSLYQSKANTHKWAIVENGKVVQLLDQDSGSDLATVMSEGNYKSALWNWNKSLKDGKLVHVGGAVQAPGVAPTTPKYAVGQTVDKALQAELPPGTQIVLGTVAGVWTKLVNGKWQSSSGSSYSPDDLNWAQAPVEPWKITHLPSGYKAPTGKKPVTPTTTAATTYTTDAGKVITPKPGEHVLTPSPGYMAAFWILDGSGMVHAFHGNGGDIPDWYKGYKPGGKKTVKSLVAQGAVLVASGPPKVALELPVGQDTEHLPSVGKLEAYAVSGYYNVKNGTYVGVKLKAELPSTSGKYGTEWDWEKLAAPEMAQSIADKLASVTAAREKYKSKLTASNKIHVGKTIKALTAALRLSMLLQRVNETGHVVDAQDQAELTEIEGQLKKVPYGFDYLPSAVSWAKTYLDQKEFLSSVKGLGFDPLHATPEQAQQYAKSKGALNAAGMSAEAAKAWMLLDLKAPGATGTKAAIETNAGYVIKTAAVAANAKAVAAKKAAMGVAPAPGKPSPPPEKIVTGPVEITGPKDVKFTAEPGDVVLQASAGALVIAKPDKWFTISTNGTVDDMPYASSGLTANQEATVQYFLGTGNYTDITPSWAPVTAVPGLKVPKPKDVDQYAWDVATGVEAGGQALKDLIGDWATLPDDQVAYGITTSTLMMSSDKVALANAPDAVQRTYLWAKNTNQPVAKQIVKALLVKIRGGEYITPETQQWTPPQAGAKPITIPPGAALYETPSGYALVIGPTAGFLFTPAGVFSSVMASTAVAPTVASGIKLVESFANLTPEKAALEGFSFTQASWDALIAAESAPWNNDGPEAGAAWKYKQALSNVPSAKDAHFDALTKKIVTLPPGVKALLVQAAQDKNTDLLTAITWKVGKGFYVQQPTVTTHPAVDPNAIYAAQVTAGHTSPSDIDAHWSMQQMDSFAHDYGLPDSYHTELSWMNQTIADKLTELLTQTKKPEVKPLAQSLTLTHVGPAGGSHGATKMVDQYGDLWLTKKYPNDPNNDVMVESEYVANRIGRMFGYPVPQAFTHKMNGYLTYVQHWDDAIGTLKGMDPGDLTDAQLANVMQAHVLNWLISNHDASASNYLRDVDGASIISIDLTQAFKHHHDDKLAVGVLPPNEYHGLDQWHDRFYLAVQNGQIDRARAEAVAQQVLYRAYEVQTRNEAAFQELVSQFLDKRPASLYPAKYPNKAALLGAIMDRKHNLVADFEKLYKEVWAKAGWDWKIDTADFGKKIGDAHVAVGPKFCADLAKAKATGLSLMVDAPGLVEPYIVMTPMKAKNGSTTVLGYTKVGEAATDQALTAWNKDRVEGKLISAGSEPEVVGATLPGLPPLFQKILGYVKTVGFHAPNGGVQPDGKYNEDRVSAAKTAVAAMKTQLAEVLAAREKDPTLPYKSKSITFTTLEQQDAWVTGVQETLANYELVKQAHEAGQPLHVLFPTIGQPPTGGLKAFVYKPTPDLGKPGEVAEKWVLPKGAYAIRTADGGHYLVAKSGATSWLSKEDFLAKIGSKDAEKIQVTANGETAEEAWTHAETGDKWVRLIEEPDLWQLFDKDGVAVGEPVPKEEMNAQLSSDPDQWIYDKDGALEEKTVESDMSGKNVKVTHHEAALHPGSVDFETGDMVQTKSAPTTKFQKGTEYVVEYGNVVIRYRPWTETGTKTQQGTLSFEIRQWSGTTGEIEDVLDSLRFMGLEISPATETSLELAYWRHVAEQVFIPYNEPLNPANIKKLKSELNQRLHEGMTEAEQLQAYRDAWAACIGKERVDAADWEPKFAPWFGQVGGRPQWYRMDYSLEDLRKAYGNGTRTPIHTVFVNEATHEEYDEAGLSYGDATGLEIYRAAKIIQSRGLLPSEERVRVLGDLYGGMSSHSDQGYGSSEFVFTRQNVSPHGTVSFLLDPRAALRAENYALSGDGFGQRSNYQYQGTFNTSIFKNSGGSNELCIKNGVPVEYAVVSSESTKAALLARLKQLGVTLWDGVPVAERILIGKTAWQQKMKELWVRALTEYGEQAAA